MFRLGYNTNGLAHHRLGDALSMLADLGYEAVSITPDAGQLDPFRLDPAEVEAVRRAAEELGLELSVETGARFLLDPRRKHRPTLLEAEPEQRALRVEFLRRSIDLAAALGARLVSLWSGAAPSGAPGAGDLGVERASPAGEELWSRLCSGLREVLAHARARNVRVAFEPEPGMFIERPCGYRELVRRLGREGSELGLTLDVGHLLCTGDLPVERTVREESEVLAHVHLDDVRGGIHEHRMFGEGDLDLGATLNVLLEVGYTGIAAVELARDSHRGADAASRAMAHLRAALRSRP